MQEDNQRFTNMQHADQENIQEELENVQWKCRYETTDQIEEIIEKEIIPMNKNYASKLD